jgi:hypothetical protein
MAGRTKALALLIALTGAAGAWTAVAQVGTASGPCTTLDRACIVEVATTYIVGQVDYSKRPEERLAPTAHRWENGYSNGVGADAIRGGDPGPVAIDAALDGPRDLERVLVDETAGEAVFYYIIDAGVPGVGHVATAHIAERFKVEAGAVCGDGLSPCITEIEAIFCIGTRGDEPARPPAEERPAVSNILCHRAG